MYLIAYEFCIRGFLLFSFVKIMDPWPSIFLMTSIYTIIHLNRGRGEASGCIVMGFIFGVVVLYTQSILLPIMIHIYIALTTDTLLIKNIHRSEQ
jgi:membrane protease YdiL (CAAX protease family)